MFIGHYSASFVAKAVDKRIPLWVLFLATQLVDIFWDIFVLVGIERLQITPGITATNSLDLQYMPYTHSLLAGFVWFGLAAVGYKLIYRGEDGWRLGMIVGAVVFSHWMLDWLVHRPDLPLYGNEIKVGLGLWNYPLIAHGLEIGLLIGSLLLYLRATKPVTNAGKYAMIALAVAMIVIQLTAGTPETPAAVAVSALFAYLLFAGLAFWLEKKRQ